MTIAFVTAAGCAGLAVYLWLDARAKARRWRDHARFWREMFDRLAGLTERG